MFDKLRQGKELLKARSQAKKLQDQMAAITESVEKDGLRVKVSADQKVVYIERNGEKLDDVVELINDAFKKVQKKAMMEMMQNDGLSGLLEKLQ
jgi:hypothetical protein